jgi:hypothetical protein
MNDQTILPAPAASVFPLESPLYFPVGLRPIGVRGDDGLVSDINADKFVAVVREDTNQVLSVQRHGYAAINNRDLYYGFEEVLKESDLRTDSVKVADHISYGGGWVCRDYVFPAHIIEPAVGDLVEFRLRVVNAFDGKAAFRVYFGGVRLRCLNGMTGFDNKGFAFARHTSGFNLERAVGKVNEAIARYLELSAYHWRGWAKREITTEDVSAVFKAFPPARTSKPIKDALWGYWGVELEMTGHTLWALYNALTRWSTHYKVRTVSNEAAIHFKRERVLSTFLLSDGFRRLAI